MILNINYQLAFYSKKHYCRQIESVETEEKGYRIMIRYNLTLEQHSKKMSENFESSQQGSPSQIQPNLSLLKKEVEISPSMLKEITNSQQYLERVIQLNNNARDSINIERAKEALVYLNEAEKILEYAAGCGKTIEKYIIISVLHNIACCYQKTWQLDKCSQYLEALIFNFNSFPKSSEAPLNSNLSSPKTIKKGDESLMSEGIDRKTLLAKYYLQFCAINSQINNHSGALVASRKAIEIMRGIFIDLAEVAPHLKKMNYEKKSQYQFKMNLIDLGSRINHAINTNNYEMIFEAAKFYLKQWKFAKQNRNISDRNYVLEEEYKSYSIGNVMQINPMVYRDFVERQTKNYTAKIIVQKILLLALGFFTVSTQLRLIANKKKSSKSTLSKLQSSQIRQAQIYHLYSIIIATSCLPFQVLYIKHALSSYGNHFEGELLIDNHPEDSKIEEKRYQQFIFCEQKTIARKNTTSNSFTGSNDSSDTVSRYQKEDFDNYMNNQRRGEIEKGEETIRNDLNKKQKGLKSKSKSKSKHIKTFTGLIDRPEKVSPLPKSPNTHLRSPTSKNNLVKIKTSYKLKVSTEKIFTPQQQPYREDNSKKKKQLRTQNIQFDYFMGKTKQSKKSKQMQELGINLQSPRGNGGSRSSSKRQSPIPKHFQQKGQSPAGTIKHLKSPRKNTTKGSKASFQQYYL